MKRATMILLTALLLVSVLLAGCKPGTPDESGISGVPGESDGTDPGDPTGDDGSDVSADIPTDSDGNTVPTSQDPSQNNSSQSGPGPAGPGGDNQGKVVEASFTRNADGTCTDKSNGVVFLHDELDSKDAMFEYGPGIALDSNTPAMFNNDSSRVTRSDGTKATDNWFTYKLDAGITEVSIDIFIYETCDPNANVKVSVSKDNKNWKPVTLTKSSRIEMTYTWAMYTVSAKGIDRSHTYLKIDLGPAPDPHWNINVSRLRINNTAKMNDLDRFLEIRPSATFYVDPKKGSDNNDGMSEAKPFKSLSKVSSKFFQEGDRVLFKKGETYSGSVTIKGYGTADNPIRVGSYGSGNMPKFVARGATTAISLQAFHVTMEDLEITNPTGLYGIYVTALQPGENPGITISGCYVHDVNTNEREFSYVASGGIIAVASGEEPTWFKGMNIQNNTVKNVSRCAVVITSAWGWRYTLPGADFIRNTYVSDSKGWYPSMDCRITGNTIDGSRGDAILIQCGKNMLIERNTVYNANSSKDSTRGAMVAIWTISTVDTVMQYNEVGYTKRITADGEAFDTDHADVNCTIQYNYSHNNQGGFVLLCNGYPDTARNATVRYNLSVNDGAKGACVNLIGDVPGSQVYNNTFYMSAASSVVSVWGNENKPTKATGVTFTNNIFAAPSQRGAYGAGGSVGNNFYNAVTNIQFNNNLFHNVNQPEAKGGVSVSGNVNGNPAFALSTDYKNKAAMIAGFTPKTKVSGAASVANNGGRDISGSEVSSAFYGCARH